MSILVFFIFKSIFFKFILSSLSLIILVGWKFYIIIFSGLPFMLWSSLMTRVIGFECWTGLAPVIFDYFDNQFIKVTRTWPIFQKFQKKLFCFFNIRDYEFIRKTYSRY